LKDQGRCNCRQVEACILPPLELGGRRDMIKDSTRKRYHTYKRWFSISVLWDAMPCSSVLLKTSLKMTVTNYFETLVSIYHTIGHQDQQVAMISKACLIR